MDKSTEKTGFCTLHKPNPELLAKYESSARIYGDELVLKDITSAKRMATSLWRSIKSFNMLPPKVLNDMRNAAIGFDDLARELKTVGLWCDEYLAFCKSQRKLEELAAIEEFALDRWRSDTQLMNFEIALVNELCTAEGLREMGAWFHSHGVLNDIPTTEFLSPFNSTIEFGPNDSIIKTCRYLMNARISDGHKIESWKKYSYRIGWVEYNNYFGHRLSVKASADNYLRKIAGSKEPT